MNTKDINDSLRSAFVRYWATKAASATWAKDAFAAHEREEVTPEMVGATVRTIILGGSRSTFGAVWGMAAARAAVLDAQLSGDEAAMVVAQHKISFLVNSTLQASISERENADAEAKKATADLTELLATAAHAVLSHGMLVELAALDDESIRMLAAAIIAAADWTEPTEAVKSNLRTQLEAKGALQTALRSSRVNWVFQLANEPSSYATDDPYDRSPGFERSMR